MKNKLSYEYLPTYKLNVKINIYKNLILMNFDFIQIKSSYVINSLIELYECRRSHEIYTDPPRFNTDIRLTWSRIKLRTDSSQVLIITIQVHVLS